MSTQANSFILHPQLEKDSHFLTRLSLCQLRLIDDTQFPWFILVPERDSIVEMHQLSLADQSQLWRESNLLSLALASLYQPDKLNLAMIGNMVSQLHFHHIVRFKNDPCWPQPVWGKLPMQAYRGDMIEQTRLRLITEIERLG